MNVFDIINIEIGFGVREVLGSIENPVKCRESRIFSGSRLDPERNYITSVVHLIFCMLLRIMDILLFFAPSNFLQMHTNSQFNDKNLEPLSIRPEIISLHRIFSINIKSILSRTIFEKFRS